jgi:hypothetical protein
MLAVDLRSRNQSIGRPNQRIPYLRGKTRDEFLCAKWRKNHPLCTKPLFRESESTIGPERLALAIQKAKVGGERCAFV